MNAPALAPDGRRIYRPDGQVLANFLMDRSEIAIIRGPWGSGKTLASCQRIFQHAVEQNHSTGAYHRGKRRSRWFVIRDSYPVLETTTLETWLEWFPERIYGKLFTGQKPYRHEIRVGDIMLDTHFMAVGDLVGEAAFQSLEPNGIYWNELEYAQMNLFFAAHGRVGRYPPLIEGGSKWSGSIADMNAPPENHWVPMMMGEVDLDDDMPLDERIAYEKPPGLRYFVQPPAVFENKGPDGRVKGFRVNPEAENLKYLGPDYYPRAMLGKTIRWIQSRLANKILPMVEGDAVWSSYDEEVHLAKAPLEPVYGSAVWIGLDFGRRPAALFAQRIGGIWQIQFEAYMEKAGASKFAPEVRNILGRFYPWALEHGAELHIYGDPKGEDGTQSDERTAYDVFRENGLTVRPAPVKQNNIETRIEAVEIALDQRRILISPRCRRFKMALAGGYRYPKERAAPMTERKPVKDKYSDIADAGQYLLLGGGSGRSSVGHAAPAATRIQRSGHRRFAGARRPF